MNELIKIQQSEGGKDVVSARELHALLISDPLELSNVSAWMTRNIENNSFALENVDYQIIRYLNESGRKMLDYAITIDFAKELCMMSQCENGRKARLYFIECEKRLHSNKIALPQNYIQALEALVESEKAKVLAESKVKELTPKADIFDAIADSTNLKTINEVAKILGTGGHRLFAWLREQHILMGNNLPYQKYLSQGYFEVKTNPIKTISKDHSQTFISGKGELWLAKIWKNCHSNALQLN